MNSDAYLAYSKFISNNNFNKKQDKSKHVLEKDFMRALKSELAHSILSHVHHVVEGYKHSHGCLKPDLTREFLHQLIDKVLISMGMQGEDMVMRTLIEVLIITEIFVYRHE